MEKHENLIFSALADKNRRRVIELLHEKESSILDLTESFDISFQALSKHINILEHAGIVAKRRSGKHAICSLQHDALKDSLRWIAHYSNYWNQSFDKLDSLILKEDGSKK